MAPNIPCDANRLGVLQGGFERIPIDGCDMIDSESNPKEYEGWTNAPRVIASDVSETVFIDIGSVIGHVDS